MFVASGTNVTGTEAGASFVRASGRTKTVFANASSVATSSVASTHEASSVIASFWPSEPTETVSVALVYCTSATATPTCGVGVAS